jgi:hypothetical protein
MKIAQIRNCFVDECKTVTAIGWRKLRWYGKCIRDLINKCVNFFKEFPWKEADREAES